MTKTKEDNNLIDYTGVVYAENDIELSWPIELGVDYDENHIEQLCEWLYRCSLCRKQNWVFVIYRIVYTFYDENQTG